MLWQLFLLLVHAGMCVTTRSYRRARSSLSIIHEPAGEGSQGKELESVLIAKATPWIKPMVIACTVFLSLAAIILSVCPEGPEYDSLRELALWVFAVPLGTLIVGILLVSVLQLLALVYDKARDALQECQFELAFLAVLLVAIIVAYCCIVASKASEHQSDAASPIMSWIAAPLTPALGNLLKLVILSDYLYICVEWLKKNHLTVFGFALLAGSFYLLYVLP